MKQYVGNKIVKSDCAQAIDVTALDATFSELAFLEPYPSAWELEAARCGAPDWFYAKQDRNNTL